MTDDLNCISNETGRVGHSSLRLFGSRLVGLSLMELHLLGKKDSYYATGSITGLVAGALESNVHAVIFEGQGRIKVRTNEPKKFLSLTKEVLPAGVLVKIKKPRWYHRPIYGVCVLEIRKRGWWKFWRK